MKELKTLLTKQKLYFDGGFGTLLQSLGLPAGVAPEEWNLTQPHKIIDLHRAYLEAGSNFITTNTFGVNKLKYDNYEDYIISAIQCAKVAKEAKPDSQSFIAFDIGPSGRMLKPYGDLDFEEAVELFAANIRVAVKHGIDCILIETMNDAYETKAAVLAAKENANLPIIVTNAYDQKGKLMTGANPKAMIALLEGLGVDAIGLNCSFGPDLMLPIVKEFAEYSSLPIVVSPNAGLPIIENGETKYDISADEFAAYMKQIANLGATILGGCCGTTPAYIRKMIEQTQDIKFMKPSPKNHTLVSSYTHAVEIDNQPILIGERINPTGKPKMREALKTNNLDYILQEGVKQAEKGVHILDVNVGLPEIDEVEMMQEVIKKLQVVIDLPLQIDSSNPKVLEKSMRIYNGKPLINSVNGNLESMEAIFPLVKKYGGTVIALTMDEAGIPETAIERVQIADKITKFAQKYDIDKKDIIVDPLCLTISSDTKSALTTLEAVKILRQQGYKTILGVSNISFGLPAREKINTSFYNSALENGLNCAIMNPFSIPMLDVYYAFRALHNLDTGCKDYIAFASQIDIPATTVSDEAISLFDAIIKGLTDSAISATKELLSIEQPLNIINNHVVPALNQVGQKFEENTIYLPQLLMSADAATASFEIIKNKIPLGSVEENKAVILATVKGDIHDIGKNIVKVLLESYGYKVHDLGKDVAPEKIVECIKSTDCRLVGLSALMTTTIPAMEETIKILREKFPDINIMVGGAVLNKNYAKMINADAYGPDAMAAVRFTKTYYSNTSV